MMRFKSLAQVASSALLVVAFAAVAAAQVATLEGKVLMEQADKMLAPLQGASVHIVRTDIKQDDLSDAAKVKKSFAAVLPKLGINYELATGQYLGFIVQKGYRGGGVNVRSGSGHEAYDPEYTTNYELSYRGSFLEDTLRARANLYYTDWKDQQVSVRQANSNVINVYNAGRSDIKGLEVFIEKDLSEQLTLTLGGAIK